MNSRAFVSLLKTVTSKVYADFVPEGKSLPALSYTHIADAGVRILSGNQSGEWNTWRVLIVGKTRSECESLLPALKALDNTSNNDFSNIFIISEGSIPARSEDEHRTYYLDFKTYG